MSSHHVIRDEQEPPVFILSIESNIVEIKQLLGWSPTVWVLEEHAEWVMSQNIKIDGVLSADPEQHSPLDLQTGSYQVKNYREDRILDSIFSTLGAKEFTGLNIFCNAVLRERLLRDVQDFGLKIPITIFSNAELTLVSCKTRLRKWYPADTKLQLLTGYFTDGNLEEQNKTYSVTKEGFIQIDSEIPLIILTELYP